MLRSILLSLDGLYVLVLFARAVTSWFPVEPGTPFAQVVRVLERLTEPVLAPVRRIVPPLQAGGMAIDLSIIIVTMVFLVVVPALITGLF